MNILQMKQQYEELKERYAVPFLVAPHTKYMFVLESAHIAELLNRAPVSGLSGVAMSSVLYTGEKKALGSVLKERVNLPSEHKGVMNICPIPMQLAAYTNPDVVETYGELDVARYQDFFTILEKIRTGTKEKYRDEDKTNMQRIILEDFKLEVQRVSSHVELFIPCGNTAQVFFRAAFAGQNMPPIKEVPHPSFGNWHKKKYFSTIEDMKKVVEYYA